MRRKRTDSLIQWKKSPSRKPLILQGLRQTGKTWLLLDFGANNTKTPCTSIWKLTNLLPIIYPFPTIHRKHSSSWKPMPTNHSVPPPPCCPRQPPVRPANIHTLAGIALDFPHYHIAAIKKGVYPDPDYTSNDFDILTLYPMDFEEFLWANAEFALAREIRAHFFRLHFHGKIPACKSTSPVSPLPDHRRNTAFCSGIQKRKKLTDGSRYSAENPRPLSGRHYCLCPKRNRHTQPQKLAFHPLSAWKKQPQIPVHPNRQRCHCQNLSGISQLADPFRPCPLLPRLRKN